MDYILLSILSLYFVLGAHKGFVAMLFSFFGTGVVIFLSYEFCTGFAAFLQNYEVFDSKLSEFVASNLNKLIDGKFSSMDEVQQAILSVEHGKVFLVLLKILVGKISFEGELTAGQIFGPSLCAILLKVFAFLILFVGISFILRLIQSVMKHLGKGFGGKNRLLGGVLGLAKGFLLFMVFYVVIVAIGNFALSEKLVSFAKSGEISNKIYQFIHKKTINLFYLS